MTTDLSSVSWRKRVPGHRIVSEGVANLADYTFAMVSTCECGQLLSAVSSTERNARRLIWRKFLAHIRKAGFTSADLTDGR